MPFVEAKCTNCGAVLPVDNARDAWVCGYCGTPFVVEKAIQQFNITNNITAETVNVVANTEIDPKARASQLMEQAMSFLGLNERSNFVKIANQALELDPLNSNIRFQLLLHTNDDSLILYTYISTCDSIEKCRARIKQNFSGLVSLCGIDSANRLEYVNALAQKEAHFFLEMVKRTVSGSGFLESVYQQDFFDDPSKIVYDRKGRAKHQPRVDYYYQKSFGYVNEDNLSGIAELFKRDMAAELKRLCPQLFLIDEIKEMFQKSN